MNLSTGVRNFVMTSVRDALVSGGAVIHVFDGIIPSTGPDAPPNGTLLGIFTKGGVQKTGVAANYGLEFATAVADGRFQKDPNAIWRMTALATGTARYGRLMRGDDTGVASTAALRIDIPVSDQLGDINMDRTTFEQVGQTSDMTIFDITQRLRNE